MNSFIASLALSAVAIAVSAAPGERFSSEDYLFVRALPNGQKFPLVVDRKVDTIATLKAKIAEQGISSIKPHRMMLLKGDRILHDEYPAWFEGAEKNAELKVIDCIVDDDEEISQALTSDQCAVKPENSVSLGQVTYLPTRTTFSVPYKTLTGTVGALKAAINAKAPFEIPSRNMLLIYGDHVLDNDNERLVSIKPFQLKVQLVYCKYFK